MFDQRVFVVQREDEKLAFLFRISTCQLDRLKQSPHLAGAVFGRQTGGTTGETKAAESFSRSNMKNTSVQS